MNANFIKIIRKFFKILIYQQILNIFNIIFFFGSILALIEIFVLRLIPVVITSVMEPTIIINFLSNFNYSFKEKNIVINILVIFVFTYVIRFFFQIIFSREIIWSSEKVRYEISKVVFRHDLFLNYFNFVKKNTGDYISSTIQQSSQILNYIIDLFGMMELVIFFEKEFKIQFKEKNLNSKNFTSIPKISLNISSYIK